MNLKSKAVLDANVLYPASLRDLLLNIANQDLFEPHWSQRINEEWAINLLKNRPDLKRRQIDRTIKLMNLAFPSANVDSYKNLKLDLNLPDIDDLHVVKLAAKTRSQLIITSNIKDFPKQVLNPIEMEAISPDKFITNLIKTNPIKVYTAFEEMRSNLQNPSLSKIQLLNILGKLDLKQTVKCLKG